MSVLQGALDRKAIAVSVVAPDWRTSVRASGELLRDAEAVEDRYVEAMVDTTEELGPYVVIAPGVAIPHARPEDGARRVVLTLAEAVEFGSKENDPVRVVFGFSTTDGDAHVELLGELADFIEDSRNTEALLDAEDEDAVLNVFDAWTKNRERS